MKGTPFETTDIDLNVLMREVFDFLSIQASARNVALHMTAWSEPLWVKGDPIHLQQVVINLIVNSMDAMAAMPYGRAVMGRTEASGGTAAVISISDSGPGIPGRKTYANFRSILYDQGAGHGHRAVHRTHHHVGAPRTNLGREPRRRGRVIPPVIAVGSILKG